MSSRRASLRKRIVLVSGDVAAGKSTAPAPGAPRKRGPRQPQPADFQATVEMPRPVPILERELRAVEILLGAELADLLNSNTK